MIYCEVHPYICFTIELTIYYIHMESHGLKPILVPNRFPVVQKANG